MRASPRTARSSPTPGVKTGRSPKDKRVVEHPDSKNDIWWGPVNIPLRRAHLSDQSPARARLSEHTRAALLLRRLRRLGSEVSHQGPRHLLAAVSRAVHAHDADPPDEGGTRELRRAGLRHLQRRRFPGEPPDDRHGIDDEHRSQPRGQASWSFSAPNTPAR